VILFPQKYELYRRLFDSDQPLIVQGKVDARSNNRGNGAAAAAAAALPSEDGEPVELEEAAEQASVMVDFAWTWNDPECVPVERRHTLHVEVPSEVPEVVDEVTALLVRHPGEDEVFLHFSVSGREVIVQAGDRYHVAAGPALAGELERLLGEGATRLVAVRPRAAAPEQPRWKTNGNGRGRDGS